MAARKNVLRRAAEAIGWALGLTPAPEGHLPKPARKAARKAVIADAVTRGRRRK